MFNYGYENSGENPPFHAPVFAVTHLGQDWIDKSGGTRYTFVTDGIKAAVEQARAVADGKDVRLAGEVSIAQQALAAGLVGEIVLHVTPPLLGRGGPCSARAIWTCAASKPFRASERSTCSTRFSNGRGRDA
jgi:dihydrofolate reductase